MGRQAAGATRTARQGGERRPGWYDDASMHGRLLGLSSGLFLLLAGSPPAARILAAQESCQSAQCHATLVQGSAVHEAAEQGLLPDYASCVDFITGLARPARG